MKITSFENQTDLEKISFHQTKGERVAEHATDGDHALKVHFEKANWPGIHFAANNAFD
jgi:hypothetical protein